MMKPTWHEAIIDGVTEAGDQSPSSTSSKARHTNILLVCHNLIDWSALAEILARDFTLDTVHADQDIVDKLNHFHADIIITDTVLKPRDEYQYIPIIQVSDDLVTDVSELQARVATALQVRAQYQALIDLNNVLNVRVQQQANELIEYQQAALNANAAKSEFLANMSHELRTPLHCILSFSRIGIKKNGKVPEEKISQYFEQIHDSGMRLLLLMNDLLDLAKLEAGKTRYTYTDFDLLSLLEQICSDIMSKSKEKEIVIQNEIKQNLQEIKADKDKLTQVIQNLLSNALKYSYQGSQVTLKLTKDNEFIILCVENHGVGIPDDELLCIFDSFTQSRQTKTGAGGTGLGLSIAREIIDQHGGKIWAESEDNGITRFYISLPQG